MEEVARSVGVTKAAINNYEHGTRYPRHDQLEALADLFGVDIDYLTGRERKTPEIFTDEELRILNAYRAASEDVKTAIAGALGVVREKENAPEFTGASAM